MNHHQQHADGRLSDELFPLYEIHDVEAALRMRIGVDDDGYRPAGWIVGHRAPGAAQGDPESRGGGRWRRAVGPHAGALEAQAPHFAEVSSKDT
jgi:hypothetical protein